MAPQVVSGTKTEAEKKYPNMEWFCRTPRVFMQAKFFNDQKKLDFSPDPPPNAQQILGGSNDEAIIKIVGEAEKS